MKKLRNNSNPYMKKRQSSKIISNQYKKERGRKEIMIELNQQSSSLQSQQLQNTMQQPTEKNRNQTNILAFMRSNESLAIINAGSVPITKQSSNIRILSLNVKGLNTTNIEKLHYLIKEYQDQQIDMALLNKTNTKWIILIRSSMKQKLNTLDR